MVTVYNNQLSADKRYISSIDFAQAHIPENYPIALFVIPWCPASQDDYAAMLTKATKMSEKWGLFRTSIRFAAGLRCHSWSGLRAFEMDGLDIIGPDTHSSLHRFLPTLPPYSWIIRAFSGVPMKGEWKPLAACERILRYGIEQRPDLVQISLRNTAKPFIKTFACDYFEV